MHVFKACLIFGALAGIVNAANIGQQEQSRVKENLPLSADIVHIDQVVVIDREVLSIAADIAAAKAVATVAGVDDEMLENGVENNDMGLAQENASSIGAFEKEDAVFAESEGIIKAQAVETKKSSKATETGFTFSPVTMAPESTRSLHPKFSSSVVRPITPTVSVAKVKKVKSEASPLLNSSIMTWAIVMTVLAFLSKH